MKAEGAAFREVRGPGSGAICGGHNFHGLSTAVFSRFSLREKLLTKAYNCNVY